MKDIRLIATDLDGTLLPDSKEIPEEIFSLVPRLREKGIRFVAASGRSPYTLRLNFAPVADEIEYICDNGAVAVADGNIVFARPVPQDVVTDTVRFCAGEQVHELLCGSATTYLAPVEGTVYEPYVRPYYFRRVPRDRLLDTGDEINKIAVCDLRGPQNGSYDRLCAVLGNRAAVTISGDVWMDVMAIGVDKGVGLAALQAHYDIAPAQTVVFGDYYNDVPMLRRAAYAFVMANANPDMFAYGNRRADSNNAGGVLKVLRSIADGTFE